MRRTLSAITRYWTGTPIARAYRHVAYRVASYTADDSPAERAFLVVVSVLVAAVGGGAALPLLALFNATPGLLWLGYLAATATLAVPVSRWIITNNDLTRFRRLHRVVAADVAAGAARHKLSRTLRDTEAELDDAIATLASRTERRSAKREKRRITAEMDDLIATAFDGQLLEPSGRSWLQSSTAPLWSAREPTDERRKGHRALISLLKGRERELGQLTTAILTEVSNSPSVRHAEELDRRRSELCVEYLCALRELERQHSPASPVQLRAERAGAVAEARAELTV